VRRLPGEGSPVPGAVAIVTRCEARAEAAESSGTVERERCDGGGDVSAEAWRPGSRVGDYVLDERIGAGGMGVVYRARHATTGAPCAIKTLGLTLDREAEVRFVREAEAQARARHPNVLRVHTAGRFAGRPYLVEDLATGGDLADRLAGGPLAPAEATRLVAAVARGVGHLHERGVLHRDLKPGNVLFDERGTPLVVDFGLAALSGADELTRSGDLLGTPAFMAPEQVAGERARIGPATDVYGLGALLYRCLAGRPPFEGQALAVLERVLKAEPVDLRIARPGVPAGPAAVCQRALAKDPADRFPSAAALADALEAEASGALRSGRGRLAALLAGGVLAAIALAAAVAGVGDGGAGAPPERAERAEPEPAGGTAAAGPSQAAPEEPAGGFVPPRVSLEAVAGRTVFDRSTVFDLRFDEAKRGDLVHVLFVAEALARGDGVQRDRELARAWYRVAAQRHWLGRLELALALLRGELGAGDHDEEEAAFWTEEALGARAVAAEEERLERWGEDLAKLAEELLDRGREAEARRLLEAAVDTGAPLPLQLLSGLQRSEEDRRGAIATLARSTDPALRHLRAQLLLEEGESDEAVRLLRELGAREPPWGAALLTLAELHARGDHGCPRDEGAAEDLARRAAAAGDAGAFRWLTERRLDAGDVAGALAIVEPVVDAREHAELAEWLGELYRDGERGLPRDLAKAEAYLGRAVAASRTDAMVALARLLLEEERGEPIEAARLLRQAAERGNHVAMRDLADLLEAHPDLCRPGESAEGWRERERRETRASRFRWR